MQYEVWKDKTFIEVFVLFFSVAVDYHKSTLFTALVAKTFISILYIILLFGSVLLTDSIVYMITVYDYYRLHSVLLQYRLMFLNHLNFCANVVLTSSIGGE